MTSQSQIVGVTGIGLIMANFWLGGAKDTVTAGLLSPSADAAAVAGAHSELKTAAVELLFVGVATLIAGTSSGLGTAMVAMMVALVVLWALKHFSSVTPAAQTGR